MRALPSLPLPLSTDGLNKWTNADFIGAMLGVENVPMIGIMDTDEHLRRRRAWTRGLGPGALKEYEELLAARARQLVRRAGELDGEVVMGWWFNAFRCVSSDRETTGWDEKVG